MSVNEYIDAIEEPRKAYFSQLRNIIVKNLPEGFTEIMQYGMVSFVVPHEIYPSGYHCKPEEPLPFMAIASQKNSINFYHMGLYANESLMGNFISGYEKIAKHKIDCGKSCIRFKYLDEIPFDLIQGLVKKISAQEWISLYEEKFKAKK